MGLSVAFVIEATNGGTARHLLDLANGLVGGGHSVHIIYSRGRAEPRFIEGLSQLPGVHAAVIDMQRQPQLADMQACIAIRRYLRRWGPFDIVHGQSSKAGALARLATLGFPAARVYTPHCLRTLDPTLGLFGRVAYGWAELILSHMCEAIIAVSPDELEHAVRLGIPSCKLHLVLNGVDQPERLDRTALRTQLGLREDEICVGFLARYVPQKAPDRLLEVAMMLRSDLPPFRIAMVGDGPLESMLRARAMTMGMADRIIFVPGSIGPRAMFAFDVFTLVSAYEGLPYVLLEAAASGLPIVATAVGGSTSVVVPGKNGFVVPNWDGRLFAQQLSRIIQDKELRLRMGRESREISKKFAIQRMVRETVDVYRTAIERRARKQRSYNVALPESNIGPGRSEHP